MSTEKTVNYQLHRWTEDDEVLMQEFNENFQKIDNQLKKNEDEIANFSREAMGNFVAAPNGTAGLQFSHDGLTVSWTAGIAYVNGRRFEVPAGNIQLNPTQGQYIYLDTDGTMKKTTSQATAEAGLLLWYFATDASQVITSTDKRKIISPDTFARKEEVVMKEPGKGLSTNDYTDADKQKLANMQEGSINQDTADARYLQAGSTNQDVTFSKSIIQQTDTRSVFLTYTNGDLTKVEEKDGTTVVKTTDLTYSSGKLTQVVETVGGKTITQTLNYDESGNLQSVTRSVV
ncbi:hypothetical protein P4S83_18850 [Aneurinibacillus thermoaerophilus]